MQEGFDLCLQASLYQQAAHCYEELLMHTPSCIAYYVQYADVMYTLGGTHASGHRAEAVASDYRTAQSYYAAAVHMSKGSNLRALYGLCAATSQLAGLKVLTTAICVQVKLAQVIYTKASAEAILWHLQFVLIS